MSLNHKEIDLVLSDLALAGSRIQKVLQPSYDTIILETFGTVGGKKDVLISLSSGACRIHGLRELPAKNERPLRFMECLKARIKGGFIESVEQLSGDRIVKFTLSMPTTPEDEAEELKAEGRKTSRGIPRSISHRYFLYARLWSGAGNIILDDQNNLIVDVLFRKPEKGEVSGLPCLIEDNLPDPAAPETAARNARFAARDLPGEGSFSERVEEHYTSSSGEVSRENLIARAEERFRKKMDALESRERELSRLRGEFGNAERFKQIGDILMAGGFEFPAVSHARGSSAFVTAQDFYTGTAVSIQVDPSISQVENAQRYYEKARKASSGLGDVEAEIAKIVEAKRALEAWKAQLAGEEDPFAIAQALDKAGTVREKTLRKYPCIWIEYKGWTLLVGRSAKENEELLRRHVRGSDLWLHARDYSGSYVFIKARRDKTFPLDLMLDAGNLALYYSKARKNGEGDVYYTQAKYLRRAKDGPKGLVIPTLEKNLFVRLDEARIKEVLACSSGGES